MNARLILLVEDFHEDAEATMWALRKSGKTYPLRRCTTGDEALDYLYGRGVYQVAEAPRPAIILLDLNLPGTNGQQVLAEVKQDPGLRMIPVIVMTTSSSSGDIQACYDAGANSYVVKPVGLDGLRKAVEGLADYWFQTVTLPEGVAAL